MQLGDGSVAPPAGVLSSVGGRFCCAATPYNSTRDAMSFRLWTIFYVFALLAAAMATFGPWGIIAALVVLAFWAALQEPRLSPKSNSDL